MLCLCHGKESKHPSERMDNTKARAISGCTCDTSEQDSSEGIGGTSR